MCAALISESASNWVDRGEPAGPILERILAHFVDHAPSESTSLTEHANIVIGMVDADSTEVHLAGYLRGLRRDRNLPEPDPKYARAVAIALWHVAKVAQWRNLVLQGPSATVGDKEIAARPLGEWLADRLLTADELEQHRKTRISESSQKRNSRA